MNEKLLKLKKDAEFIAKNFDEKYCKISEEYMIELDKDPYEKKWNYILDFLEYAAIGHSDIYWRNNCD